MRHALKAKPLNAISVRPSSFLKYLRHEALSPTTRDAPRWSRGASLRSCRSPDLSSCASVEPGHMPQRSDRCPPCRGPADFWSSIGFAQAAGADPQFAPQSFIQDRKQPRARIVSFDLPPRRRMSKRDPSPQERERAFHPHARLQPQPPLPGLGVLRKRIFPEMNSLRHASGWPQSETDLSRARSELSERWSPGRKMPSHSCLKKPTPGSDSAFSAACRTPGDARPRHC